MHTRSVPLLAGALAFTSVLAACSDSTSPAASSSTGTVVVKLTDAPFLADSAQSVDIFVVRVDARTSVADSAAADSALDSRGAGGWKTIASPNASVNLLSLQNGASTTLGTTALQAGTYNGLRFIIDPSKSSITLKNGTKLTSTSTPSVTFPSASRSGIKVLLTKPLTVVAGTTTTLLIDFDLASSFVLRGNSIHNNGLLFKPVIRGTVIDAATVNANVRLANATADTLTFRQNGTAMTGGSSLLYGTSSSCSSVAAATPGLTVTKGTSTTPISSFSTTLQPGNSYTIVAYPTATGTQFVTLSNAFAASAGQTGLQVFNATGSTTGYDVFVTPTGGTLATPTISNTLSGNSSAFVSVPTGSQQVTITSTGTLTSPINLGTFNFTAGQNATLVIAPPAAGSTTPRAFLVTGC